MKKLLLFSAVFSLFLAACSKDQQATNKLDGNWVVTSKYVDGVPQTLTTTTTYAFVKCNIEQKKPMSRLYKSGWCGLHLFLCF